MEPELICEEEPDRPGSIKHLTIHQVLVLASVYTLILSSITLVNSEAIGRNGLVLAQQLSERSQRLSFIFKVVFVGMLIMFIVAFFAVFIELCILIKVALLPCTSTIDDYLVKGQ